MPFIYSYKVLYFAIAYTLFIIYGSLVPLNYHPIAFDKAWVAFTQIRYLNLGAASRADWIANIVLYIPLTFSLAFAFSHNQKLSFQKIFISLLILIFSVTLATTIEFFQQFFPPRTVSQNDLIAETMGSFIGLSIWFIYGRRLVKLWTHILYGGKQALLASLILYSIGYLALSIFPYDFVTSTIELKNTITSSNNAFFISSACGSFIICSSKLLIEMLIVLPIGILAAVLLKNQPQKMTIGLSFGFVASLLIELVQLFLISGVSQGISILIRLLGFASGGFIYQHNMKLRQWLHGIDLKIPLLLLTIPYIFIVARLSGWSFFTDSFNSSVLESLKTINWLPFYYHYYTTEAVALTSLLSVFALYSPIGLAVWLWNYKTRPYLAAQNSARIIAAFLAMFLCFLIETGKLFFIGKHPDPTNLIISFSSAFIIYSIVEQLSIWIQQAENPEQTVPESNLNHMEKSSIKQRNPLAIISIIIISILLWKAVNYPNSSLILITALCLYAGVLWRFSQAWLLILPALLPIADLSPWTGRLFFSEFDYFILLTLAINLWHGHWKAPWHKHPGAFVLLGIYTLLYSISLLQGLFPLAAIDTNSFAHYYSSYNSVRVAKGFFWALILLPLFVYHQQYIKQYFTSGLLIGLSLTAAVGIWERSVFAGLFDFSSDFRISSTFYSMHTGGADLDAYLLLTMPFIYYLFIASKSRLLQFIISPLLFSLSLYVLLMTYSRGAYIAFAVSSITFLAGLIFYYKKQLRLHWKKILWFPVFIITIMLFSLPVLNGSFIQERFKQSSEEVDFRSSHWKNAIDIMDKDLFTQLFGMGLGSFPKTYLLNNLQDKAPASFLLQQEKKKDHTLSYLTLGFGKPLYIEQIIDIAPYSTYQLIIDYRAQVDGNSPTLMLCEKAVQHSFNCQKIAIMAKSKANLWQHVQQSIKTSIIGDNNRPVKLVLTNQTDSTIDIKNISLTLKNINLVKNSNFSMAMDHWFFSTDTHAPWRIENLWVQLLFDQGWLGLITFNILLCYVLFFLFQQLRQQNHYAVVIISSLIGFLIIAVIDSPFDTPNITLLFFMIMTLTFIIPEEQAYTYHPRRKKHRHRSKKNIE